MFKIVFRKAARLFVIKTRWEAYAVIYALAVGAAARGQAYLVKFPGAGGVLMLLACTVSVFMAGAKILDCLHHERRAKPRVARACNDNDRAQPIERRKYRGRRA